MKFMIAAFTLTLVAAPLSAAEKGRKPSSINQQLDSTTCSYYGKTELVPGGTLISSESSTAYNAGCRDGGGRGSCEGGSHTPAGKDCCHCEKK